MNVKIWDIKNGSWKDVKDVKMIYQSVSHAYFKLDNTEYNTDDYDLSFIIA